MLPLFVRTGTDATVGLDGSVARLDSLDPVVKNALAPAIAVVDAVETKPPPAAAAVAAAAAASTSTDAPAVSRKRKDPPDAAPANSEPPVAQATDWTAIQSELQLLTGNVATAQQVVQLLDPSAVPGDEEQHCKYVALPKLADKQARRKLHEWIRARLKGVGVADTAEGAVRIWAVAYEKEMPNYGKFDGRGAGSGGGGGGGSSGGGRSSQVPAGMKFLKFVLYKENMDTGSAIGQIQKRSGGGGGGSRNGQRFQSKLRMGFCGMKDKRGITSQFVTVPASTPIHTLCSWNRPGETGGGHTARGGVGVVRTGNFEYSDTELRLGRLQGNRFDVALRNVRLAGQDKATTQASLQKAATAFRKAGFINYFGVQRFGKYHDTHLTGVAVLQGDYEKAIDIIMSPKPEEREQIAIARKAWAERFEGATDRAAAEKSCANKVSRDFGRFMASESAVLQSLARTPLDYKRAFSCISKTMRMMFIHAVQSYLWNHVASLRIDTFGQKVVEGDLVLDKENGKIENSADERSSSIPAVKLVSADDVVVDRYSVEDIVLPLIGSGTRDPDNECSKLFDELLEKQGITRKMLKRLEDRDFNCTGDYRKVLCRPSDVDFEILEYKNALTPLMQTDLMKVSGIELDLGMEKEGGEDTEPLLAMVVGFTLPSSSYATIALRELMKQPTNSEYQRELKLDDSVKAV